MPNEAAQFRDALTELANLRLRDERLRRASDATAMALQILASNPDPGIGPFLLLEYLGDTLGVADIALCTTTEEADVVLGSGAGAEFAETVAPEALRSYLAKREMRAVAEPDALTRSLSLTKSFAGDALLSGRVAVAEAGDHLVVCGGSRDLLGVDTQDLFRRFLPLFAQAIQRRIDGIRAVESEARERSLIIARDAAEQANADKTEFVSRMSHELRTPLNAILGFAELLDGELTDPSQREYLGLIDTSGKHLLALINSVLDYSKIEAGAMELEHIAVDLRIELDAVRVLVTERAAANRTTLRLSVSESVPAVVTGDPTRIRQILVNLVGNAVKFTEDGTVEVTADLVTDGVRFTIADTGIGMAPDVVERAFQPFAQGNPAIARRYGGTGLGLVIARDLVRAMSGTIGVESEAGKGSTFTVVIPHSVG